MIRTIVIFYICTVLLSSTLGAQKGHSERSKEYYVQFITQKLKLTSHEADKFWPIMHAYKEKQHAAYEEQKKESAQCINLNSSDAEKIMTARLNFKREELKRYEELISSLRNVIPIEKIVLIDVAERELRHSLMDKVRTSNKAKDEED